MTRLPQKLLTAALLSTVAALGACAAAAAAPAARAAAGNTKKPDYDGTMAAGDPAPAPRTETAVTAAAAAPLVAPAVLIAVPLGPAPRAAAGNTKQPCYDGQVDGPMGFPMDGLMDDTACDDAPELLAGTTP